VVPRVGVGFLAQQRFEDHPPIAVVTGSGSGIGDASGVALAEPGFDVGITWNTDEQGAQHTAEKVPNAAPGRGEPPRPDPSWLSTDQLDHRDAVSRSYVLAGDVTAPFLTKVVDDMLVDIRAEVEANPNHKVVFVGRESRTGIRSGTGSWTGAGAVISFSSHLWAEWRLLAVGRSARRS
jgi:NAD(P)-dependent dehydrogenase (short-subunit alcohol dehydrogenase family)